MWGRAAIASGLLIAIAIACLRDSAAATDDFVVIVHPDNPIASIPRDTLRDAFLKKTSEWSSGESIRPIELARRFPARDRFNRDVLRKSTTQLKSYWSQQIYSGKAVPPPEAATTRTVIEHVLSSKGAIGYLPAGAEPGGAKVVRVQ